MGVTFLSVGSDLCSAALNSLVLGYTSFSIFIVFEYNVYIIQLKKMEDEKLGF